MKCNLFWGFFSHFHPCYCRGIFKTNETNFFFVVIVPPPQGGGAHSIFVKLPIHVKL